jgi:hypothetical protein
MKKLAESDDKYANKFMEALADATSAMKPEQLGIKKADDPSTEDAKPAPKEKEEKK